MTDNNNFLSAAIAQFIAKLTGQPLVEITKKLNDIVRASLTDNKIFLPATIGQTIANLTGQPLVEITKQLNDVVGSTAVDRFMDAAHGVGHRVAHGHSLDNLPYIYEKFGINGVGDYFVHGFRDAMSPHGMPIPYAKEFGDLIGVKPLQEVHWLSANIGDLLSGSMSIVSSIALQRSIKAAVQSGSLPMELVITATIGAVIKLGFGFSSTNPVTITSGVFDLGSLVLAYSKVPLGEVPDSLKFIFMPKQKSKVWSFMNGAIAGSATAGVIGGALHSTTESDSTALANRILKMTISGAFGGAAGVAVSTITAAPAAIAAGAIGGYVAAEWAYENQSTIVERSRNISNSIKGMFSEKNEFELGPDFLFEH